MRMRARCPGGENDANAGQAPAQRRRRRRVRWMRDGENVQDGYRAFPGD